MAMKAWEGLHLQRRPASSDHALPCRRSGPPHSPQTARRSIRGGQRGLVRAATHNAAAGARAGWSAKRRQRCPGRSGTMPQAVTALQPRGLRWASVGGCCGSAPSRAPPDAPFSFTALLTSCCMHPCFTGMSVPSVWCPAGGCYVQACMPAPVKPADVHCPRSHRRQNCITVKRCRCLPSRPIGPANITPVRMRVMWRPMRVQSSRHMRQPGWVGAGAN